MENCRKSGQGVDVERLSRQIAECFLGGNGGVYRGVKLCNAEEPLLCDIQEHLRYPLGKDDYPVFVGKLDPEYFNVDVSETVRSGEVVSI